MTKKSVATRRKRSRRTKVRGGGGRKMFATLATIAFLCYIRHKVKTMWNSGQSRRCIFYFLGALAVIATLAFGIYTYYPTSLKESMSTVFSYKKNISSAIRKTVGLGTAGSASSTTTTTNNPNSVPSSTDFLMTARLDVREDMVKYSMKKVINYINDLLRPFKQCAFLDYTKIVHAELKIKNYGKPLNIRALNLLDEEFNKWSTMYLKFQTTPGDAAFLAKLGSTGDAKYENVLNVERISGMHVAANRTEIKLEVNPSTEFCHTNSPTPLVNEMCVCEKHPENRKEPYANLLFIN